MHFCFALLVIFVSAWHYNQNSAQGIQTRWSWRNSGSWHSAFQIFILMSHLIQLRWAYTSTHTHTVCGHFCLKFGRSKWADVGEAGIKKPKWGSGCKTHTTLHDFNKINWINLLILGFLFLANDSPPSHLSTDCEVTLHVSPWHQLPPEPAASWWNCSGLWHSASGRTLEHVELEVLGFLRVLWDSVPWNNN